MIVKTLLLVCVVVFLHAAFLCGDERDSGLSPKLLSCVRQRWQHVSKRVFSVCPQTGDKYRHFDRGRGTLLRMTLLRMTPSPEFFYF